MMRRKHAMPFGAEILDGNATRFGLWAPAARQVDLCLNPAAEGVRLPMHPRKDGWFEAIIPNIGAGTRYLFSINGAPGVPDPASRSQPEGVHGPSEVIDVLGFEWTDHAWRGRAWDDAVFYELHVGAFTKPGSFSAVAEKLDYLAGLGVTALELMPIAATPGKRNWGYDGVYLFAPHCTYGRPDDLKALVVAAHAHGLMVFLDVVYNHFGPEGNYLHQYAPQFFTERHKTPWGAAINFDGGQRPVRDFFIHNALYWLEEFHLDGLRLDAVHAILDDSAPDILTELAETVAAHVGDERRVHLVLENDHNASRHLDRTSAGRPRFYTAQWNDDIHHALHVLTTGEASGYYSDFADAPARHLARALTEGFAYQGDPSPYRNGALRGEPSAHLPPTAFIGFLQNHDQIGNRALGDRITSLAGPDAIRAAMTTLLLAPSPPLLFMGEEWGSRQPFPFFCDFGPDLADAVREGRRREFERFPEFHTTELQSKIPDPNAPETFASAVLDWAHVDEEHARQRLDGYKTLLALRHREIVPRLRGVQGHAGRFRRYGKTGVLATWRLADGAGLTLAANLGRDALQDAPERPKGRLLFATSQGMTEGLSHRSWPLWSVAWLLDESPKMGRE